MRTAASFAWQTPLLPEKKELRGVTRIENPALAHLRTLLPPSLSLSSGAELIEALRKGHRGEKLLTTLSPLDQLLGGGLPRGKMVELTARRSAGRFAIALATLAAATSAGEAAALVDHGDQLDPAQLVAAGAELERILWVRPRKIRDAMLAAEMLIATRFPLVIVDLGLAPRGRRAPDAAWIRLGRAAEGHGTALLVLTPFPLSGTAAEALVAAHGARGVWQGTGAAPRLLTALSSELTLERHRHERPGGHATLRFTCDLSF